MKTKLFLASLIITAASFAQTYDHSKYYISELVTSPPNSNSKTLNLSSPALATAYTYEVDDTLEYFEFRGTPNETIDNDVYFVVIDGDGNADDIETDTADDNIGLVRDAINLGGLQFGSNGILSIVANMTFSDGSTEKDGTVITTGTKITNPYAVELAASGATVVTVELTGTPAWKTRTIEDVEVPELDKFNSVSVTTNDIGYDGTINDQSATYMIVKATGGSPKGADVDANNDGSLDADADNWTIYDSVSILDDDDLASDDNGEYAYGKIVFVEILEDGNSNLIYDSALSPTIVTLNQYPNYIARQGTSVGYACSTNNVDDDEWMAGRVNSNSFPDWKFSSNSERNVPTSLTSTTLSDLENGTSYGEVNDTFNDSFNTTLSTKEILSSEVKLYPNPISSSGKLNIATDGIEITSVSIFDALGNEVLKINNIVNNIDVSSLTKGVYLVKIISNDSSITKKIAVL